MSQTQLEVLIEIRELISCLVPIHELEKINPEVATNRKEKNNPPGQND